ncbi:DUF998 domain-containing protein [Pseudanabaena sp. UWO311]|uniref:DUF998 domain-containing protein n=1 Tax=Pseudanabaena sp. UWO311 TaxID=2487337 RepID=UPI00115C03B3|nr:DUF998 domain-containing protein [Pseudanabaena sp. UWO311]TYQ26182.1 DUF998 domain-containing protein [Pseudanabaena sp. UWO311]
MNKLKLSGFLFFLAGAFALMGIITAEAFYPSGTGYTTFHSEVSDLGATRPPNSIIYQPSSSIFNTTMLLSGLMTLTATFYQHRYFRKLIASIPLGLFSLGLVGIGIFPGDKTPYHGMFAMLAFLSGGFSAIATSAKITSEPFKYIGILLGSVALLTWSAAVFFPTIIVPFIGIGGAERWIVYSLVLWLTGLGGYLMNKQ